MSDEWSLAHSLRHAIEAKQVDIITCPVCYTELRITISDTDRPAFKCLSCRSTTYPGSMFWNEVARVLKEISD